MTVKRDIGEVIGGYTVTGVLGQGGSGAVYRVEDSEGEVLALKLVEAKANSVAGKRLAREVQALQSLRHPAVPLIVDAELEGDVTFVVFELVEGVSLFHHVHEHGPLQGEDLARFAEITAKALEAVHAAGVVHRDVTPSNIMMGSNGPVLIDFGLSHKRHDARLTREGLVSGTAGYVAPEVIDGEEPGPEADCWSWAATVAFAMTGTAPFGTGAGSIGKTLKGKFTLPDVQGAEALAAALGRDVEARPGPRDVVAALRGASISLPVVVGATAVMPTDVDAHHSGDDEGVEEWLPGDWDDEYEEPEEPFGAEIRRPVTIISWTVAIALSAAIAPLVAVVALYVCAVIARTTHRMAWALYQAQLRRGYRKSSDAVVQTLGLPWHLVRAMGEALVAWTLGLAAGTGVAWLMRELTQAGGFGDNTTLGLAISSAMGGLVVALVTWWGPLSAGTRDGGHRVATAFAPTSGVAAVWTMVAIAGIAVIVWFVGVLETPTWWWPVGSPWWTL